MRLEAYSKEINITLTSILAILLVVLIPVAVRTGKANKRSQSAGKGIGLEDSTPTYAPIADAQECPLVLTADALAVTGSLNGVPGQKVWIKRSEKLCTLWQVHPDKSKIVPVARTYLGYDWEASAASGDFGDVSIECVSQACGIILPEYLGEGFYFELAAFDHDLPKRDEIARFLEQTTFGPTRADLDSFTGTFAHWVKQQQSNVPITSHRQYYREHLNARSEYPYVMGTTTHPCKAGTRYRKYPFTEKYINPFQLRVSTDDWGRRVFSRVENSSDSGTNHRLTVIDAELSVEQSNGNVALPDGV